MDTTIYNTSSSTLSQEETLETLKKARPTTKAYLDLLTDVPQYGHYLRIPEDSIKSAMEREYGSLGKSPWDEIQWFLKRFWAVLGSQRISSAKVLFDVWAALYQAKPGYTQGGLYVNSLSKNVEQAGELVDIDELYTKSFVPFTNCIHGHLPNKEDFITRVLAYLGHHHLNPWANEFSRLTPVDPETFQAKHGFDPHRMAYEMTGENRDLQQKLWTIHHTGAIGRFLSPGYDLPQSMLILLSETKGLFKTRWIRALTGPLGTSYYLQTQGTSGEKKEVEKFRGKTILNIDECDRAFRGTHGADLKENITNNTDNYRASYDRVSKDYPRSVVWFGTTNQPHLIQDHAGDRRFFIIHCRRPLRLEWLKEHWADFWGFYVWCYQQAESGNPAYKTWLSQEENREVEQSQAEYKTREPWMDALDAILEQLEETYGAIAVLPSDLRAVLDKEMDHKRRWTTDTIKDILLTERGYKLGRPKCHNLSKPKSKPHPYLDSDEPPIFIGRSDIEKVYMAYQAGPSIAPK